MSDEREFGIKIRTTHDATGSVQAREELGRFKKDAIATNEADLEGTEKVISRTLFIGDQNSRAEPEAENLPLEGVA